MLEIFLRHREEQGVTQGQRVTQEEIFTPETHDAVLHQARSMAGVHRSPSELRHSDSRVS